MDVLSLLQSKKRCLRRYLSLSVKFLASAKHGDLTSLETFELLRESVIKTLGMYDRKITSVVQSLPAEERTPALSSSVQSHLNEEAALVQSILKNDNQIIAAIEVEKRRLLHEMANTDKAKAITNRFKSAWMPESGEGLDTKI